MPSASFRFGADGAHEVKVQCGYFGSEKYLVNGVTVLSLWSLRPSGVREFSAHGHRIQIRMSVTLKKARAEALVDGRIVSDDLFAEFNSMVAQRMGVVPWLVKVAVWFGIALAVFSGLKLWEKRPNPTIERTASSVLRTPPANAHVQR